jgi:O-antigen/teichoic acid export membrane protein
MKYIKTIGNKLGVDKAIAYSSGARIIQAFTGVVSIFFIATFLSKEEQGFYYTFGSLLAIQVFFELGLTSIITQYVAHEAAHLKITEDGNIEGEEKYRSRLASLVRFSVKWYGIIALLYLTIVIIVGFIFFYTYDKSNDTISWRIPWVLICIGSAISLFQAPLSSILMGLGKVKEMSKISFYQQIILPISSWMGLLCGVKLYVIGISSLLSALIWGIFIIKSHQYIIFYNLWKEKITEHVHYMKEIFPYQWRIALSWISGFFIFQLFNPVLFAIEGAVIAGQMGMTLNVLNAIQALSLNWLNTKVPLYSRLIALKDFEQLDKIFNQTLKQMTTVCFSLLFIMFIGVWFLRLFKIGFGGNLLGDRFLDYIPMLLMMIPLFINQFVSSWATYLRCHKQEPFLINSICAGIACSVSTIILGNKFGLYGITIGYCMITLAFLPWGHSIYKTKKNEWHGK